MLAKYYLYNSYDSFILYLNIIWNMKDIYLFHCLTFYFFIYFKYMTLGHLLTCQKYIKIKYIEVGTHNILPY